MEYWKICSTETNRSLEKDLAICMCISPKHLWYIIQGSSSAFLSLLDSFVVGMLFFHIAIIDSSVFNIYSAQTMLNTALMIS